MNRVRNESTLESRGLSVGYGKTLVLTDVSFSVGPGEFVALMGPNGSGKTTLLKTLLGLLAPASGEVLLDGRPILFHESKERAKRIGYAAQEPSFSFPLTVEELVTLGRYPHAKRLGSSVEDREAVAEALRLTESTALRERKFTALSGGERQKALIARVLAQTSHCLLMDEPTTHLDIYYQLQILETLKKICREKGSAIVAVLHDLNLVSLFADKALLLKEGKPMAYGKVAEVVNEKSVREIFGVEILARSESGLPEQYFLRSKPAPQPERE